MSDEKPNLTRKSWDEFREAGLLWWVNRILHLFGWAITVIIDDNGKVIDCYPAHCKYRGFSTDSEEGGFRKLTNHLKSDINRIEKDL